MLQIVGLFLLLVTRSSAFLIQTTSPTSRIHLHLPSSSSSSNPALAGPRSGLSCRHASFQQHYYMLPTSQSSFLLGEVPSTTQEAINSVLVESGRATASGGVEEAFKDDIVLFDSTIQLLAIGFGILVLLAVGAKSLLNSMDAAIENVLEDFETTLKAKYPSRWTSIETKLDGLQEPERSQTLFQIMEQLQETEPTFMEQVNRDMGSS